MNLANKLTLLRVFMIPVFLYILMLSKPDILYLRYTALAIFILASITDALDGHIARKYNMITSFGKLMDPLADKILVSVALIALIELGDISALAVIIVIAREFIISGFRLIATERRILIVASPLGKLKTVTQMLAIILILCDIKALNIVTDMSVYIMCILSIISLVDYIIKNKEVITAGGM